MTDDHIVKTNISESIPPTILYNVRVNHIRPHYKDLKEWMANPENVYIGRKGIVFVPDSKGGKERWPKKDSIWANPFKVDKDQDTQTVITKYEIYIRDKLKTGKINQNKLFGLCGKNLGCWCVSRPIIGTIPREKWICHGCVLIQLIEELSRES